MLPSSNTTTRTQKWHPKKKKNHKQEEKVSRTAGSLSQLLSQKPCVALWKDYDLPSRKACCSVWYVVAIIPLVCLQKMSQLRGSHVSTAHWCCAEHTVGHLKGWLIKQTRHVAPPGHSLEAVEENVMYLQVTSQRKMNAMQNKLQRIHVFAHSLCYETSKASEVGWQL